MYNPENFYTDHFGFAFLMLKPTDLKAEGRVMLSAIHFGFIIVNSGYAR